MGSNANKASFLAIAVLVFILSPVLSTQETADPAMLYVIAMIVPTIVYCVLRNKIKDVKVWHILAVLLWFSGIISSFIGPYGTLDIRVMKYLLFVIFYICVTAVEYSPYDLRFITKYYNATAVVIALLILLSYIGGYAHSSSDYYMGRYSVGITGLYKNPNYLTSFINLSLFVLAYGLLWGVMSTKKKTLVIGVIVFYFVAFFLSGTRAALLLGTFIIVVLLLRNLFKNKHFVLGAVPIILILFLVIRYFSQISDLMSLFLGNRAVMGDNSRTDSWGLAFNLIKENPVFGCGLYTWDNYGRGGAYLEWLHNIYLELFLNQGILGGVLGFSMIFAGIGKIKKEDRFFVTMFIIVAGFPLMFQNGLIAVNFWRFVILTRMVIDYSRYSEKGIHELFLR